MTMTDTKQSRLTATLLCVTPPDEHQEQGIRAFLQKKYGEDVALTIQQDASLKSGFQLHVGSEVYDWSAKGRMEQFRQQVEQLVAKNTRKDIIPLLRSSIDEFRLLAKSSEVGTVKSIGDGIAVVEGLEHAAYGEILMFDNGIKGMVQDLRRNETGCILFDNADDISAGSKVARTGKTAGVPVGDAFLGRVVDALGRPIDGGDAIPADGYRPVEEPAPGIIDRQSVDTPMETGLLSIDAMFPIGRGQRELIIGDRQTGKTAIALDAMLNQKGKNVICVYVAIGQKASSVAQLVENLRKRDAMDYCVVVSATAGEADTMQYIAPYAGCAMAEYYMHKGRDVLIVYDDLSKHAIAYRAMSLLLERAPGREAYPGDVFYLHSRLLERSAHLSDKLGGGSMTALPIVETQAGDVSAYIPTNIISITDGQIFLESDLFFAGQRPAVNVGLSVSRVGGAAQTKATKKATGSLRLDLAQYREMEVFTQFSSDLDDSTKEQLHYGQGLMRILRQKQYHPLSMHQQVIVLVCAMGHVLSKVAVKDVTDFRDALLDHFEQEHSDLCRSLEDEKVLTDDMKQEILRIAEAFRTANAERFRKE
ncbi:MAG: F0F1 ATP synthase subunit alpha [Faecalibacterium sp.]|jgi:F-type H+-transporting ATPase subunit alpha|nr:F0F1 ATP synthase subunit alpha [Clostridiales bacterium]MCI5933526.1 F0F1 ATP synthase subunit alpha [Faecalibacterium sp.]